MQSPDILKHWVKGVMFSIITYIPRYHHQPQYSSLWGKNTQHCQEGKDYKITNTVNLSPCVEFIKSHNNLHTMIYSEVIYSFLKSNYISVSQAMFICRVSSLYSELAESDGFLYFTYTSQQAFGH